MLTHYRAYALMFLLNLALLAGVVFLLRRDEPHPLVVTLPTSAPTSSSPLTVRVTGAVRNPGQYTLDPSSDLAHLLQRAGGVLPSADLSRLDLTAPLSDRATIDIPARSAELAPDAPAQAVTASSSNPALASPPSPVPASPSRFAPVHLNTATQAELEALPGIGPVLAARIIEYRTTHGPFRSPDELLQVRGIGPSLYNTVKEFITVP